jgi:hypothetical protein
VTNAVAQRRQVIPDLDLVSCGVPIEKSSHLCLECTGDLQPIGSSR